MGFTLVIVDLEVLCLSSPSQTSRNASLKYQDLDLSYVQNQRVRYSSCMNTDKHKVRKEKERILQHWHTSNAKMEQNEMNTC